MKQTTLDQIPVALTVLKLVLTDFVSWGMKAAAVFNYPDLNGLIDLDHVGHEDVILLKRATNVRSKLVLKYANVFNGQVMGYLNLFAPVIKEIVVDDLNKELADDIYFRLIYDNPFYSAKDLDIDLELFAYSVMHTMYCLCELVICGSVNLDAAFDNGSSYDQVMNGTWDCYLEHQDREFKLVAKLMDVSVRFYNELTNFLLDSC